MASTQKKLLKRARPKPLAQLSVNGTPNASPSDVRAERKKRRTLPPMTPISIEAHHCWFVQWEISSITAMAASPDGNLIVTARKSGCIELRRRHMSWASSFLLHWDASDETAAVSVLAFDKSGEFLLLGRFNGSFEIYTVNDEGVVHFITLEPGGGAILSLATHPSDKFEVAIGCEDGCVRFLSVDSQFNELNSRGILILPTNPSHYSVTRSSRSDGMCLSLSWKPYRESAEGIIVCGDSTGQLRWIAGASKEVVGRGAIPSREGKECKIWTVQIVASGRQVLCGDSRGMVSTWCSSTFTKIEENQIEGMAGDIWTSAVEGPDANETEKLVFGCAGGSVGSLTSMVSSDGSILWTPVRGRAVHPHDVKHIASLGSLGFVTASTDTRLCVFDEWTCDVNKFGKYVYPYHGAAGQNPIQHVTEQDLLVSKMNDSIECWQLPGLHVDKPTLALRLKLPEQRGNLRACAVSNDASQIAVSSEDKFSLYRASRRKTEDRRKVVLFAKIDRVRLSSETENAFAGAEDICFMGSSTIAISKGRKQLLIYDGSRLRIIPKRAIGTSALFLTHIACCSSSMTVSVSDSLGGIFSATISDTSKRVRAQRKLFRNHASFGAEKAVSCMQFSKSGKTLVAALSDCSLAVVSFKKGGGVGLTKPFPSLPTSLGALSNESTAVVSGPGFSYFTTWIGMRCGPTISKLKKSTDCIIRRNSVLTSGVISKSRVVIVQRNWQTEFAQLPRVLPKKLYGM